MSLNGPQREQLVNAFLDAFPQYVDLKYVVETKLSVDLDMIVSEGGSRRNNVLELIKWADAQGRLKELLFGALRENPKNSRLVQCGIDFGAITAPHSLDLPPLKFDDSVTVYKSERSGHVPIPWPLRSTLVDALLRLPDIQTFHVRSNLLHRLPSANALDRNSTNARQDLVGIIDQLSLLGQTLSREWPLILLLDAAIEIIPGYTLEEDLQRLRRELLLYYKGM